MAELEPRLDRIAHSIAMIRHELELDGPREERVLPPAPVHDPDPGAVPRWGPED